MLKERFMGMRADSGGKKDQGKSIEGGREKCGWIPTSVG